jgi:hypothetical protein
MLSIGPNQTERPAYPNRPAPAILAQTGPVSKAGSPANRGLEPHRSGLRVMTRRWRARRGGFTALPYYSPNDLDEREGMKRELL